MRLGLAGASALTDRNISPIALRKIAKGKVTDQSALMHLLDLESSGRASLGSIFMRPYSFFFFFFFFLLFFSFYILYIIT
ncbi:MAG: hypothetical protein JAY74_04300 [Candidatus Thiodiazotropha taylori]|nr:hypothetical protein [Candidatus Thiodiazotropha taylori]